MMFYLSLASLLSVTISIDHGRQEAWRVDQTGAAEAERLEAAKDQSSLMRKEFTKKNFLNGGFWNSEATKKEKARTSRTLAVVKPLPTVKMSDGTLLNFHSAIPVFVDGHTPYVAFLLKYNDELWNKVDRATLMCHGPGFSGPMDRWGGEHKVAGQKYISLLCRWPLAEAKNEECFDVGLQEYQGPDLGSVQVCHDHKLNLANYKVASCVGPAWEDKAHSEASGFLLMPQWLEYNLMHGIDHFLFYTVSDSEDRHYDILKPYLDKGVATRVHINTDEHDFSNEGDLQQLIANDCLFRMKHSAEWLIPTMDVDEYIKMPDSGTYDFNSLIPEKIGVGLNRSHIHALMFGRYIFRHPDDPQDLQLTSIYREKDIADAMPKYVVRPERVFSLFTHWPTSWEGELYPLGIPPEQLVAHHYRAIDKAKTTEKDKSLFRQHKALSHKLESRYQSKWSIFCKKIDSQRPKVQKAIGFSVFQAEKNVHQLTGQESHYLDLARTLAEPLILLPPSA